MPYRTLKEQPENPFAKLIPDQSIAIIPSFVLESGVTLFNVPVAYSTRGQLAPQADNALVICHALSGSADVSDWWGPLLGGQGKAFDLSRFFVICINILGSPYGTASPVTNKNGDPSAGRYGPEFPLTTIRDDVRLSKLLLDDLGVKQIAAAVGGSMGGMAVLEYAYYGKEYVKTIVPIATSARNSAWCISWGEAQRQSIYSDPKYDDGYYDLEEPPAAGLGAARMAALLTYRSRDSFEARFGRNVPKASHVAHANGSSRPRTPTSEHFETHNEGHKTAGHARSSSNSPILPAANGTYQSLNGTTNGDLVNGENMITMQDPEVHGATFITTTVPTSKSKRATTYFSAQSYLRYQGDKFIKRFDANCYIAITRKMDTHDVSVHCSDESSQDRVKQALGLIEQPTLVLGINSDGLFTFTEQQGIANGIPNCKLETIDSLEGHDAFLLQFEQVNKYITEFFKQELPEILAREPLVDLGDIDENDGKITKNSTFGEAEVADITAW